MLEEKHLALFSNDRKAKMYNFLKFSIVSTVIMDYFKHINCRILNIHGRISCQTCVRVSIFSFYRCINRNIVHVQKYNLFSFYVYCTMLRSANIQTNVKIDHK